MIYRNVHTGAVIRSNCVIQGNGWEPVEEQPLAPVKVPEAETLPKAAEKPKAGRRKK